MPRSAVAQPVPSAGYSGTPLPKKLGIGPGVRVLLLGAPVGFERTLGELPAGVRFLESSRARAELAVLFVRTQADLVRRFPRLTTGLSEGGRFWIAWPKKASGLALDLDEDAVRGVGLEAGYVDYKVCAIDETWSGLLFARRKTTPAK